tara:strand:+ start:1147 stop:1911 length:765 start_codon:yes stop_codon:yes gene_type:complete
MLTLGNIKDKVYFDYRKSQLRVLETERLGIIHVSDLIKPCLRNVVYSKFIKNTSDSDNIRSLFYGQAVHQATWLNDDKKYNEMFLGYDYVRDEPVSYEEAIKMKQDDPKQLDIIYGSIDDLVKVGDEWIITDKKTTGSIDYFSKYNSKPSESHVLQINRYRVLLDKCYNINAKFGAVVYISNNVPKEGRDKPVVLSFKLDAIEKTLADMIDKARKIKEAYNDKIYPERTKCYLCDGFCPYATKCFSDSSDKIDE